MNRQPHTKTVLLADSSYDNLSLLGKRFRAEGFNVLTAIDGRQAIAISQGKKPDIIIVEKNISLVDGFIVCKIIKSGSETAAIPFILLTDKEEGLEIENDFLKENGTILQRPFELEILVKAVKTILSSEHKENRNGNEESGTRKRFLVVEDNELNQTYIRSILTDLSFEMDLAENGEEALRLFNEKEFDLILMDVNIPLIDGIELTNHIRNICRSSIPIVAITGHSEKELIDKCLNAGMTSFLTKPFQVQALKQIIFSEISKSQNTGNDNDKKLDEERIQTRKYDYSQAIKLSNGDNVLFEKWLSRFLGLVRTGIDFIDVAVADNDFSKRSKIFHELINYSGYFGVDELRLYIKELQSIQKFSTDSSRLENFYKKIKRELHEIEVYFKELKKFGKVQN